MFLDKPQAHFTEVAAILLPSEDLHDASAAIAPLLDVDEVEVEARLHNVSLFSLTRTPSAARATMIEGLRRQS